MRNMGELYILSGPAAGGKSKLVKELMKKYTDVKWLTRYTTRPKREGEVEGEQSFFIDDEEFDRRNFDFIITRSNGRYGIHKKQVDEALRDENIYFYQIVQDYGLIRRLKELYGGKVKAIFIYASPEILEKRMMNEPDRQGEKETPEVKRTRLEEGIKQINLVLNNKEIRGLYDYIIRNDGTIEEGLTELERVIQRS
jgi:guanylate kinase